MFAALLLFLLSIVRVAQPAGDAGMWYFGYDDHNLIMYTADGERRNVLTIISGEGDRPYAWRIDEQSALVQVNDAESYSLYRVSPDEIARIDVPAEVDLSEVLRAIGSTTDYVVFTDPTTGPLPTPALLVDLDAASANLLTGLIASTVRFSEDGTALRYMSMDEENRWTLLERDLASGTERALATVPDAERFLFFASDTHGERWIYLTRRDDAFVNPLVSADGTISDLMGGTDEQPLYWSFFGDMLISMSPRCDSDCTLITQMDGEETTYDIPFGGVGNEGLAQPTPDSLLVVHQGEDVWLLREGKEPLNIGKRDPVNILTPPIYTLSPDKRYILTTHPDSDEDFLVWDLQTAAPLLSVSALVGVQINFFDDGFNIIAYGNKGGATLYRYADGSTTALPNENTGIYFDLLPDGTLLYMKSRENEAIGERGIYRYDPKTETYTPLFVGVSLLYPQPLG